MSDEGLSSSGKHHRLPELRIVLIGGRELNGDSSKKSATGNIILGETVFDTSRRTAQSVAREKEVHGRRVTVVDTPGWWWHYPRKNTPKLDKLEIMNSVHLCHPGPDVFLLVIPAYLTFPKIFKPSLQEHLLLFHKGMFNHTIVLFTAETPVAARDLQDEITLWSALQWVLQECGNRTHILNVNDGQNSAQVRKLFKKIDALVIENGGSHYCVNSAAGEALREKLKWINKSASKRFAEVQTQRRRIKALIEGGKSPPAHLRLVMVGAQWSAKSSSGNTILRKKSFSVHHRRSTQYCELSHSVVADRQLTVIDSPGWAYNHTLTDTCQMDRLEIESSMYMCPPGPHAVLLVVGLAAAFNTSYQRAVQEHMGLFSEDIWAHTLVLFSRGDWLGMKSVEERIESEKGLRWLVEKCGNRYHVLDNMNYDDEKQVTELLEKIEEMWAGNTNSHYEIDLASAEQIEAKKEAGDRIAKKIRRTTEMQSRVLKELFRGEIKSLSNMRIVLLGKKHSGKSMAGNSILFEEVFETDWSKKEFKTSGGNMTSVLHQQQNVGGVNIAVVEVPGWDTSARQPDWLKKEVLRSVSMCAPGPHALVLVVSVCQAFTEDDRKSIVELLAPFSERVWRHCMILFTWGDWLVDRSVEEYVAREGKALQWLVEKCGNRYHELNCNNFIDASPVIALFQKIIDMVTRNKGNCFTPGDKVGKSQPVPSRQERQAALTEEEWDRRELDLIDRMMKAVTQEPEEPTLPPVRMVASIDGAFIPSMSGHVPSEVGSTLWGQKARARVSEWLLSFRFGSCGITSGVGSMTSSTSHTEKLDHMTEDNDQAAKWLLTEKDKMSSGLHPRVSSDTEGYLRRHSC
ncbi:GTPase IMAP family member 8-like [Aulostomus maculatus]